jgi:undecaprenyl diphosphate synthase
MDNGIRLNAIGDLTSLPQKVYKKLQVSMAETSNNKGLTLTLALSYSSRWEITNAVRQLVQKVEHGELKSEEINEQLVSANLNTAEMPDPELMIRTGGEFRISNYLLWQLAYAELYFTPKLWPDFRKEDLFHAVIDYQKRERRFGMISEQLN